MSVILQIINIINIIASFVINIIVSFVLKTEKKNTNKKELMTFYSIGFLVISGEI